jgi:phage/plasmid-associated DNA primase
MKVKNNNNEVGGVVSYFLQEIEFQVLDTIYNYCIKKGYINDDKHPILCYDGIMIHKSLYKEAMLDEFNKVVNNKFGFDLKFAVKDMNQDYLDILDKHIWSEEKTQTEEEKKKEDVEFWSKMEEISEFSTAEMYYRLNKNKYLFQEGEGWFCYNINNTINYTKLAPVEMGNSIARDLLKLLKEFVNRLDPSDKDYLKKQKLYLASVKKIGSDRFVKGVVSFLRDYYKVDRLVDRIDNNMDLIVFDNLLFDFSIKQFREIKREDYVMMTTKYNINTQINYDIREDILKTLTSIFPNEEIVDFFLISTALSLFKNNFEKFYIHTGSGGNGKGLMSSLLEKALGDFFMEVQHTFLTTKFEGNAPNSDLYKCKGKRYVNVTEPESNKITDEITLNTEFLKRITGGDTIVVRDLHKSTISYKPQFTPNLQCNNMPKIKRAEGLDRRLVKIDYPYNFVSNPNTDNKLEKQRDPSLKEKFKRLDYANQYILLLIERVCEFNGTDIIPPTSISNSTTDFFNENNPVLKWINENYVFNIEQTGTEDEVKKYKTGIYKKDLYDIYINGNGVSYIKAADFYSHLLRCSVKITKSSSKEMVRNIRELTREEIKNRKEEEKKELEKELENNKDIDDIENNKDIDDIDELLYN